MDNLIVTKTPLFFQLIKERLKSKSQILNSKHINDTFLKRKLNIVIIDYSKEMSVSIDLMLALKEKSKLIICLIPSYDELIYRTIPYYEFDFIITYPFSPLEILKIANDNTFKRKESKTKYFLNMLEEKKYDDIVNEFVSAEDEEQLIVIVTALLVKGELTKAELFIKNYYLANNIPIHPRLKLITGEVYENEELLKSFLLSDVDHFSKTVEGQVVASLYSIPIDSKYTAAIGSILHALQDDFFNIFENINNIDDESISILNLDVALFFNVVYLRKFKLISEMNNSTLSIIAAYLTVHHDEFLCKLLLTSIKDFDYTYRQLAINKLKPKKIDMASPRINYSNNVQSHKDVLQQYKRIKDIKIIKTSFFFIGLHSEKGALNMTKAVDVISNYFDCKNLSDIYNNALKIKAQLTTL